MIDADKLRALAERLRGWWTPKGRSYIEQGYDSATDVHAAAAALESLLDERENVRKGDRVLKAAVDAYRGRCTITDHNLANAVREYLNGETPQP